MATNLKGKKVLITSGPTWVPIDKVRVISNTSTGKTGILLANKFARQGSKVTLLLGPVEAPGLSPKVKLIHFSFFDELNTLLRRTLVKKYDIVIQAAAVSDFKPASTSNKKISSRGQGLKLMLKPTPKIINCLRKISPRSFLAGFKFEPEMAPGRLINEARKLIRQARLDCAVANTLRKQRYSSYLVETGKIYGPFFSKEDTAGNLVKLIRRKHAENGDSR